MARKLIVANWKENPKTIATAKRLFDASARAAKKIPDITTVICPPSLFLEELSKKRASFAPVALGAQDVFWEESGAFTGGEGPKMLRSLGVKYVIVGHSERRKWFKETDAMVNKKVLYAAADGLHVILCIGEPIEVRKKGMAAAKRYLLHQLTYGLKGMFEDHAQSIIVAYEPIWAIGTGRNDEPLDAAHIAAFIKEAVGAMSPKSKIKVSVLYGGSVNSGNIADYVQLKEINGALVGGASLKADEFKKLMQSAVKN